MSVGRTVPWASWEEWLQVGTWLQASDAGSVQQGLERVDAWRLRGRMPLGVESTASLAETRLSDARGELSERSLRMQYSLAVVRMVNGITDSSQKGRVAASVASLAGAAGMPRILVDPRHDATHNELPTLPALRLATCHALAWLDANYWRRQADALEAARAKIGALVGDYVRCHAAAAAAAAPRRQRSSDSEEDDGESEGVECEPYNAAEGRKRRAALLSEMKSAVPRPAAGLLIPGLLRAQRTASASVAPEVATRAVSHAMRHLVEAWPQLGPLILQVLIGHLSPPPLATATATAAAAAAAAATSQVLLFNEALSDAPDQADVSLWLSVLFPERVSEPAAIGLLTAAAAAYATHAQQQLVRWAAGGEKQDPPASLAALIEGLMAQVSSGEAKRRCRETLSAFSRSQQPTKSNGEQPTRGSFPTRAEEPANEPAEPAVGFPVAKRRRALEENGAVVAWRLRRDWQPCAVGMMPSAVDSNGKLPKLDLPAAFSPPQSLSGEGGKEQQQRSASLALTGDAATGGGMRVDGLAAQFEERNGVREENEAGGAAEEREGEGVVDAAAVPYQQQPQPRCLPPPAAMIGLI